jgi:hypothetical protein
MDNEGNRFAEEARNRASPSLLREFWEFLRDNKKWWLIPILIVLLLFAVMLLLTASPAAPFIYPLF